MSSITIKSIEEGLKANESWVNRAIVALADHASPSIIARRQLREYRDELRSFGKIEDLEEARRLCLMFTESLLDIATKPSYEFKGKMFVMTGKLENFTRSELTSKLEGLGAFVASSVSPRTDIVIVGSKPGAKFSAAQQYGIPMWNELALLESLKPVSKRNDSL